MGYAGERPLKQPAVGAEPTHVHKHAKCILEVPDIGAEQYQKTAPKVRQRPPTGGQFKAKLEQVLRSSRPISSAKIHAMVLI